MAAKGRTVGALGPAAAVAMAGEAPVAGELAVAALGPTTAPGVEAPARGVGLWRTRDR